MPRLLDNRWLRSIAEDEATKTWIDMICEDQQILHASRSVMNDRSRLCLHLDGMKLILERESAAPVLEVMQELHEFDLIPGSVECGQSTFVDVGANVGLFTLLCHRRNPNAQFYCFEPDPISFEILEQNVLLNNVSNIELFRIAVGRREAKEPFARCRQIPTISGKGIREIERPWLNDEWIEEIVVESAPLDLCLASCDGEFRYVKIDVEGSECDVIAGAQNVLRRSRLVRIEAHSVDAERVVRQELFQIGFQLTKRIESGGNGQYVELIFARD